MRKNLENGFTLIELLAVIIILAVIALIATPIILNVVDKAKENSRQSSVSGYADATRLAIIDTMFSGTTPKVDKDWAEDNVKKQGQDVICEEVMYSNTYGVVLHSCEVDGVKPYYFASGKVYKDVNDPTYKAIYDSIKDGSTVQSIVSNISDKCAKSGNRCTSAEINTDIGVSMDVRVGPTEIQKFYVLSDDGINVTLLMDRNLDLDGNGIPNDAIMWNSTGNGEIAGPTTVLESLENKTNAWTNIETREYSLQGTNVNDYNGCHSYDTCTSNQYTMTDRTARARLPRIQEISAIGCDFDRCPKWSYDHLKDTANPILGANGYWTSTANWPNAWSVAFRGQIYTHLENEMNIRPVITISKSDIN